MLTVAEPIEADVLRLRHLFLERPDLRLSSQTVALLLDISSRQADRLLESLVREGFLQKDSDGEYQRVMAPEAAMASRLPLTDGVPDD